MTSLLPKGRDKEEEMEQQRGFAYEEEHVHAVYDQIASHFSSTRYKPWPIVDRYLRDLPIGSVGVDVGCGNGKYLSVNKEVFIVASDRAEKLVEIAASAHTNHTSVVADTLSLPHPLATFDFAISIAVTHHLSTPERRVAAIKTLLDVLKSTGTALIFVWALEQKDSRRGWDNGDDQDVMVPWVTVSKSKQGNDAWPEKQVFHRYYHLYKAGELEEDIAKAGGAVVESGYEKDNWWAIARPT